MSQNLLITMSGGTTTVINSTLAGIIVQAKRSLSIDRIYGGAPGILGVLNEDIVDLTEMGGQSIGYLKTTPGSGIIGTTRIDLLSRLEIERLSAVFEAYNIGYFINIGGNGTVKQTQEIAKAFDDSMAKIVAAPKTVDNDLGDAEFEKVYFTPGFPSCVQYWFHKLHLLNQDNLGAYSHDRVLIAQTFGRETGFLAGCVRAADPERKLPLIILLPEDQQTVDRVMSEVENQLSKFSRSIIVLSEGYDLGDIGEELDHSGQVMYGSSRTTAAQLMVNHCLQNGIQARAVIPAVDQRVEIALSSSFDLELSFSLGQFIVASLEEGDSHFLASIARSQIDQPDLIRIPFREICGYSRRMPECWLDRSHFDVTDEYVGYIRSLTSSGRPTVPSFEGIPIFCEPPTPVSNKVLPPWKAS